MEKKVARLETDVQAIKERNKRVELDKAWETSVFRIVLIAVLTYLVMTLVMYFIGVDKFYINAFVPTIGFILSTLSVGIAKGWWIKRQVKN